MKRSRTTKALSISLLALCLIAGPGIAQATESAPVSTEESSREAVPGVSAGVKGGHQLVTPNPAAQAVVEPCEKPQNGKQSICIEKSKKAKKDKSAVPPLTMMSVQPVPDWCRNSYVGEGIYQATRFQACASSYYLLTVRTTSSSGVTSVTGTMEMLVISYHYGAKDIKNVVHQISVIPSVITGDAAGMTVSGTAKCWTNCVNYTTSFPAGTLAVNTEKSGEFGYGTTATTAGSVGATGSEWNLTFKAPKAANPVSVIEYSIDVRCDTAVPGKTTTGCVIPAITPGITYNPSYYPEFTAHVAKAQQSGLPGAWDQTPLHRLVDPSLQASNRSKACPSSWVRPTNKSCDEYPFSSTHEGAYTGGGTARTWPECQITLPAPSSTGPTGYSVCMINAAENSSAGSVLDSVLYAPNRVISGDAFYVGVS